MTRHDATTASCRIFTFKEGVLTAMGHDLEIEVTRFWVDVDVQAGRVSAWFDARSLRVRHALVEGAASPATLSAADRAKIEGQIAREVLEVERFPDASFESSSVVAGAGGSHEVTGRLCLHGVTRPLVSSTRPLSSSQRVELELDQRDYGIKPYRALLGALRVQPVVRVCLEVPNA